MSAGGSAAGCLCRGFSVNPKASPDVSSRMTGYVRPWPTTPSLLAIQRSFRHDGRIRRAVRGDDGVDLLSDLRVALRYRGDRRRGTGTPDRPGQAEPVHLAGLLLEGPVSRGSRRPS